MEELSKIQEKYKEYKIKRDELYNECYHLGRHLKLYMDNKTNLYRVTLQNEVYKKDKEMEKYLRENTKFQIRIYEPNNVKNFLPENFKKQINVLFFDAYDIASYYSGYAYFTNSLIEFIKHFKFKRKNGRFSLFLRNEFAGLNINKDAELFGWVWENLNKILKHPDSQSIIDLIESFIPENMELARIIITQQV